MTCFTTCPPCAGCEERDRRIRKVEGERESLREELQGAKERANRADHNAASYAKSAGEARADRAALLESLGELIMLHDHPDGIPNGEAAIERARALTGKGG